MKNQNRKQKEKKKNKQKGRRRRRDKKSDSGKEKKYFGSNLTREDGLGKIFPKFSHQFFSGLKHWSQNLRVALIRPF